MLRSQLVSSVSFIVKSCGRSPPLNQPVNLALLSRFSTLSGNPSIQGSPNPAVISRTLPALFTSQYQPSRGFAARKGTRARKEALKKKNKKLAEAKKAKEIVFKGRKGKGEEIYTKQRPFDDSHYSLPIDDVYFYRRFMSKTYPFEEAIQCLRETHHPTVYNVPNAPLFLRVNMDMKYPNRATKVMDGWRSVVEMPSPFLLEGMSVPAILAFCIEDADYINNVVKEGKVEKAGGKELIKLIQTGDINTNDYEYLIAHPAVIQDLTAIRGLIKKKFPQVRSKTIDSDLVSAAKRLKSGVKIQVIKNDREPDFAYIDTPIGTLDQEGLYENFVNILADALPKRVSTKAPSDFILSCVLRTPGNGFEEFKIDLKNVFGEVEEIVNERKAKAAEEYA